MRQQWHTASGGQPSERFRECGPYDRILQQADLRAGRSRHRHQEKGVMPKHKMIIVQCSLQVLRNLWRVVCFHRETNQAELQHVKLEITIYMLHSNSVVPISICKAKLNSEISAMYAIYHTFTTCVQFYFRQSLDSLI
jgi:hypothetical protein